MGSVYLISFQSGFIAILRLGFPTQTSYIVIINKKEDVISYLLG